MDRYGQKHVELTNEALVNNQCCHIVYLVGMYIYCKKMIRGPSNVKLLGVFLHKVLSMQAQITFRLLQFHVDFKQHLSIPSF